MEMVEEAITTQGQENVNQINMTQGPALPPRTPNYGKTPKYIKKFKEEAKQKEERKDVTSQSSTAANEKEEQGPR